MQDMKWSLKTGLDDVRMIGVKGGWEVAGSKIWPKLFLIKYLYGLKV